MKKLLPIIIICLFILQCEQGWLEDIVDPTDPTVEGCNISTACNYNPDVTKFDDSCEYLSCLDCLGYPNGGATADSCGTCDAAPLNDCTQDCAGTWGGTAYLDGCEDCVGGNTGLTACTTGTDCAGVLGGTSYADNCGTCDSDASNDCSQDCNGDWGGSAVLYNCGVCGGDDSSCEFIDCTDNTSDYCQDLNVLQEFIDNSQGGTNPPPSDLNPLNLGEQTWINGRLESLCVSGWFSGCKMDYELSGEIPSTIGSLTNLNYLRLTFNNLTGEIPSEIYNLVYLESLQLQYNNLTGTISPEIKELTYLEYLNLIN